MKAKFVSLILSLCGVLTQAQINFTSLDSALAYADRNSTLARTNDQQKLLAKWTKVAALANTVNLRNPVSFSMTDNLMLPVNFLPAETFGGPAGTYKQITLGQQYVSNFNFNPQIDIINPANWARVKSASVNEELTETNALLNKKNLLESVAASYCNILSMQEQVTLLQQSLAAADTLWMIAKNKHAAGLIRQQDLNNAEVNLLLVKDKLNQVQLGMQQQYNSLKILCDIPTGTKLNVVAPAEYQSTSYNGQLKASSTLTFKSMALQAEYLRSELRVSRWSMLPVLSAFYFQGWQQNSNVSFFDSKQPWIQSQYIGLRISVPIPPDATRLSMNYSSKVSSRIASFNAEHAVLQNELNNQSLNLDYEKSYSSFTAAQRVSELKDSNYQKSLDQYKEGILSTELMLTSFSDMLNARMNYASARAAQEYAKAKININNLSK